MTETHTLAIPGTQTATSLTLPADLPFGEWQRTVGTLIVATDATQWWAADAYLHGERVFGEDAAQAVPTIRQKAKTLQNWVFIARHIPPERRRHPDVLSFSIHAEVASLDADLQEEWLERAEAEDWTVAELRAELEAAGLRQRRGKEPAVEVQPIEATTLPLSGGPSADERLFESAVWPLLGDRIGGGILEWNPSTSQRDLAGITWNQVVPGGDVLGLYVHVQRSPEPVPAWHLGDPLRLTRWLRALQQGGYGLAPDYVVEVCLGVDGTVRQAVAIDTWRLVEYADWKLAPSQLKTDAVSWADLVALDYPISSLAEIDSTDLPNLLDTATPTK